MPVHSRLRLWLSSENSPVVKETHKHLELSKGCSEYGWLLAWVAHDMCGCLFSRYRVIVKALGTWTVVIKRKDGTPWGISSLFHFHKRVYFPALAMAVGPSPGASVW